VLRRLLQHIEHYSGAGIVYLFSDYPLASHWLLEELGQRLHNIRIVAVSNAHEHASWLTDPLFEPGVEDIPRTVFWLWLDDPDVKLDLPRDQVLARLNENRAALDRNEVFIVMVLPTRFQQRAAEVAPDLWSVRSASYEVPAWAPQASTRPPSAGMAEEADDNQISASGALPSAALQRRWEQQWDAWRRAPNQQHLSAELARQIASQYLAQHRLEQAERFASQALELSRYQLVHKGGDDPASLRDLSLSLSLMGNILLRGGHGERARHLFDESLRIERTLLDRLGEHQRTLNNLSVSLANLGDANRKLGHLEDAQTCYREALQIGERIVESDKPTVENSRGLSVLRARLGSIASALGDLDMARHEFARSLQLNERVVALEGANDRNLRDSIGLLLGIGNVDLSLGRLQEARTHFAQAVQVSRRLLESNGEDVQKLRDLSVVLERIGDLAHALQDLSGAQAAYGECLAIRRKLVELTESRPGSLRDLGASLGRVGMVARDRGDLDAASDAFEESLALSRTLTNLEGRTPTNLHHLTTALRDIGDIARAQGRLQEARQAYLDALGIEQELVGSGNAMQRDLGRFAYTLRKIGEISKEMGDTKAAWDALHESVRLGRAISENGSDPQLLGNLLHSLTELENFAQEAGQIDEAAKLHEEASTLLSRMEGLTGLRQAPINRK